MTARTRTPRGTEEEEGGVLSEESEEGEQGRGSRGESGGCYG